MRTTIVLAVLLASGTSGCDEVYGLAGPDEPSDAANPGEDASVPMENLVAWFPLESADSDVRDVSGYGHVGICQPSCPTVIEDGRIGKAVRFDRRRAIGVNSTQELETIGGFTISGWYRVGTELIGTNCPFNKAHEGIDNSWQLCLSADRSIRFYTADETDNLLEGDPIQPKTWTHIVIQWDMMTNTRRLFVNGLAGAAEVGGTRFNGGVIGIGADFDDGQRAAAFEGDIDDLRIYNRALSLDEIILLYSAAP